MFRNRNSVVNCIRKYTTNSTKNSINLGHPTNIITPIQTKPESITKLDPNVLYKGELESYMRKIKLGNHAFVVCVAGVVVQLGLEHPMIETILPIALGLLVLPIGTTHWLTKNYVTEIRKAKQGQIILTTKNIFDFKSDSTIKISDLKLDPFWNIRTWSSSNPKRSFFVDPISKNDLLLKPIWDTISKSISFIILQIMMTNEIKIRPTIESDLIDYMNLIRNTWQHTYQSIMTPDLLKQKYNHSTLDIVLNEINDSSRLNFVVVDQTLLIGYFTLLVKQDHYHLERIYLIPEYQQRGLGSVMMQKCIDLANDNHIKSITLDVWDNNVNAMRFYERFGFENTSKSIVRFNVIKYLVLQLKLAE
ncbi:acyl-CoA N-acyltransferase [Globomyces pollinis-pini]|nr:acyl-CoA N-acyltransferase [Globomyces pollinis-pini]